MRQAARTDANHQEIMKAFRACGFSVHDTSKLGNGFPDLTVYRPRNGVVLVEIKDGTKPPSKRRLTPAEEAFAKQFPVAVVHRVEDVIELASGEEPEAIAEWQRNTIS